VERMLVTMQVALLIVFCLTLVKSTEIIVVAVRNLARRSRLGTFSVTAFILALATSLPELVVGITASIEGLPEVVLGNILGSNIADISLVIGGAAIAAGSLRVSGAALKRDIYMTFGAAILPVLLIADHVLSAADGLVLLVVYVFFVMTILRKHAREVGEQAMSESPMKRLLLTVSKRGGRTDLLKFLLGVGFLVLSSHMVVQLAQDISLGLKLPILLVGLFLVAVGTSLPELVFEMKAVLAHQTSMAYGDLLGSIVANATLITGVSAVIHPIRLDNGLTPYYTAIGVFVLLYLLFILFGRSKSKLTRWEGMILLFVYFGFVVIELARA